MKRNDMRHEHGARLAPPKRSALLLESRVALDLARMVGPLLGARASRRPARGGPLVIVVPGFGSSDGYTLPLRSYLQSLGFDAEGWGLGKNLAGVDLPHTLDDLSDNWDVSRQRDEYRGEASVPYLCDRFMERVAERHEATGRTIALVGWSLGGYIAREAARDLPDVVDRVVTMGSPTIGGPKYTAAAGFFRARGMDLDWIEAEIRNRESRPIRQPITAIYSKSDGVVNWQAAMDHHSERVTHIEVGAAHLGMGFNPVIWSHVVEALEAEPA
jgi:pimeloyl-ACP methyl ester carboxylesterase